MTVESGKLIRVGVTGAQGLLGWHFRCHLHRWADLQVVACDRESFADDSFMERMASSCDVIVHLAGMNRGDDSVVARVNIELAERLVGFLRRAGRAPQVIYASTTHVERDTPYGNSKRIAGEILGRWAEESGAVFLNCVLPHVFGEHGRPFYNSVVATFCHQIANRETPQIQSDGQLELLHAQDVAALFLEAIRARKGGKIRATGSPLSVSALLTMLQGMAAEYRAMVIPSFADPLKLRLFNTYRSYLFPDQYPVAFTLRSDPRGHLFECVRTLNGGQCFVSTTRPGIVRGNHYHTRKLERFAVIGGDAVIRLRRLYDNKVHEFPVSGAAPVMIDMPTLHTHNITNTGAGELVTLFWSHEFFDPADPDTFGEPVSP